MTGRLVSLDVFRGWTIALMILVNNPGSWAHIYPPLRHAHWHGWTPTDLVFPFFLFIVGVAVSLSFAKRREAGDDRQALVRKVASRSALIFAGGLLLNGFPFGFPLDAAAAREFAWSDVADSLSNLRLWGVLQRIAVCYLAVGLMVVVTRTWRLRVLGAVACLVAYELLMRLPLVAGWGAGSFALPDNFVRWVDLELWGEVHLYQGAGLPFDPEGLVSSLPAIVTALGGFFVGEYLRRGLPAARVLSRLVLIGGLVAVTGWACGLLEPVNKQLWTVSYTVLTGGLAVLGFVLAIWLLDVRRWRRGTLPAVVFGSNPLVAFVGSGLLARVLGQVRFTTGGGDLISVKGWIYTRICVPLAGDLNGSLLYAVGSVLLWLAILWFLYRRRIFVRI